MSYSTDARDSAVRQVVSGRGCSDVDDRGPLVGRTQYIGTLCPTGGYVSYPTGARDPAVRWIVPVTCVA